MMNHIAPVISLLKDILTGVDEDFDLVADFQFHSNQSDVHLMINNHDYVFVFQPLEFLTFEWHSVYLVFCARQVVHLPLLVFF